MNIFTVLDHQTGLNTLRLETFTRKVLNWALYSQVHGPTALKVPEKSYKIIKIRLKRPI